MSNLKQLSKKEIRDRRKKVISLVLRGYPRESIADKFNMTTRTLDSDIAAVKKDIAKRLDKMTKYERLSEYEETSRMRNGKLWNIVLDITSTKKEIMKAVALLQKEDIFKLHRDRMIGIFPKEDLTLNLTQYNLNTADKIKIEFENPNDEVIDIKPGVEDD